MAASHLHELLAAYDEARRDDEAALEPNNAGNIAGDVLADGVRQLLEVDAEVCGVEWDDRDDPTTQRGHGYSCELEWEHDGPHRAAFEWVK